MLSVLVMRGHLYPPNVIVLTEWHTLATAIREHVPRTADIVRAEIMLNTELCLLFLPESLEPIAYAVSSYLELYYFDRIAVIYLWSGEFLTALKQQGVNTHISCACLLVLRSIEVKPKTSSQVYQVTLPQVSISPSLLKRRSVLEKYIDVPIDVLARKCVYCGKHLFNKSLKVVRTVTGVYLHKDCVEQINKSLGRDDIKSCSEGVLRLARIFLQNLTEVSLDPRDYVR